MKKFILFLTLAILSIGLMGCEAFQIISTNQSSSITTSQVTITEISTSNVITDNPSTSIDLTTIDESTAIETTTEAPLTTIVSDEIYLQLNAGQDTIEINGEWTDAGALFVINDISFVMETSDSVQLNVLGVNSIVYHYSYQEKNYQITRYVMVVDQTPPTMTLNLGIDTIKVGETWIDAGVSYVDNSLGEVSIHVEGHVDHLTPGTYVINYFAEDASGNISHIKRYVTVIE